MTTIQMLHKIASTLNESPIPRSNHFWGGADVVIRDCAAAISSAPSFYPEPRCVEAPCAGELSWLFEKLRDAFGIENRLDGCSKIEFFGRLANAANLCISQGHARDQLIMCRAVLHEAFAIYGEMESGEFVFLPVAADSEIAADCVDISGRIGYVTPEDTMLFFRKNGLPIDEE